MKKVLFVCDGKNFSSGAFNFIKWLNESEKILLTGVFLLSIDYRILIPASIYPVPGLLAELVEGERENIKSSVSLFEELCIKNTIEYRLHEESKAWNVIDFVKESRFSDLLVISEEMFFKNWGLEQPNHFMRQVMHYSECAVMVIPEAFVPFNKVLIAYDAKPQALFAMKLFSLLFPKLAELETNIVYVEDEENEKIPDLDYLEEYASRHFLNLNIEKLHFDPDRYLTDWVRYTSNSLLITGAFSRSGLSNLFKESFVKKLIKEHCLPVFIAHNS